MIFAMMLSMLLFSGVEGEAAHGGAQPGNNWMIEHLSDSHELEIQPFGAIRLPEFPPLQIFGLTIDFSPTKHTVFLWIAAIILVTVLVFTARRRVRQGDVPHGFANAIEMIVVFIRDEIIMPTVGKDGLKFLPFLSTVFFFILTCNLLGLVPNTATPTGNINVTAGLAIIAFLTIQGSGIVRHGFFGYFKGLMPSGIPTFVMPVMAIVEFIGLFTKPFALTVRLFANMIAGHIVIYSLIGLMFLFGTVAVAPVSVSFALFIYLMEFMIAFLQAYIFTILTALFIGLAVHQEH